MYIYGHNRWPRLIWDEARFASRLAEVRHEQGILLGRMGALGLDAQEEASIRTLTQDAVNTSQIEGETLSPQSVRSSLARKLGLEDAGVTPSDQRVDGLVEVLLDATRNHQEPLHAERLFAWHAALFPTGWNAMGRITIGDWRTDRNGPMQVVSGRIGNEKVHFQAPPHDRLEEEMKSFISWFNAEEGQDPVLKSALAHFYFLTIHPFDDGNGRIARALADLLLARADRTPFRFYSMSTQIQREKKAYYDTLEQCQKGPLDISVWMEWYLHAMGRAIERSQSLLGTVLVKAEFWKQHAGESFHERQRDMLNQLLDGFEGKLTSTKWGKLTRCSQDMAQRDINDLIRRNILEKASAGGFADIFLQVKE
jgi:Fic family protein